MRTIALPVTKENLRPHFGDCKKFAIYRTKKLSIIDHSEFCVPEPLPCSLPEWLADQNITDVIVNEIEHKAIEIFNRHKINVFVGAELKNSKELVMDYLSGVLKTNGNFCND
ncbi:MAG: hypothetical protein JW731_17310 [Bacteroidales bacterium]|nr:hypothetical protein [Bacteroidales bacterium]